MPINLSGLNAQKASSSSRFAKGIKNNPNLIAKVLLCVIALLMTTVVMLRFPNLGAIIAQYNQI
jgi:hypothetical protein